MPHEITETSIDHKITVFIDVLLLLFTSFLLGMAGDAPFETVTIHRAMRYNSILQINDCFAHPPGPCVYGPVNSKVI